MSIMIPKEVSAVLEVIVVQLIGTTWGLITQNNNPDGNYMFKANNRIARATCEICSKLTIKTPERRPSGVLIVNFEHISHLALVLLLLTLSI